MCGLSTLNFLTNLTFINFSFNEKKRQRKRDDKERDNQISTSQMVSGNVNLSHYRSHHPKNDFIKRERKKRYSTKKTLHI